MDWYLIPSFMFRLVLFFWLLIDLLNTHTMSHSICIPCLIFINPFACHHFFLICPRPYQLFLLFQLIQNICWFISLFFSIRPLRSITYLTSHHGAPARSFKISKCRRRSIDIFLNFSWVSGIKGLDFIVNSLRVYNHIITIDDDRKIDIRNQKLIFYLIIWYKFIEFLVSRSEDLMVSFIWFAIIYFKNNDSRTDFNPLAAILSIWGPPKNPNAAPFNGYFMMFMFCVNCVLTNFKVYSLFNELIEDEINFFIVYFWGSNTWLSRAWCTKYWISWFVNTLEFSAYLSLFEIASFLRTPFTIRLLVVGL